MFDDEKASQRAVKEGVTAGGIAKPAIPHTFCHFSEALLLQSGYDIRTVQELLGHADIATTQIYTHLDFQHLAKVYDAAHPRARRRKAD